MKFLLCATLGSQWAVWGQQCQELCLDMLLLPPLTLRAANPKKPPRASPSPSSQPELRSWTDRV